jgi:nitrite reductase/ring-hydroxylating ferredoxin subunit
VTVRVELTPGEVRALDVAGFLRVVLPTPVWLPDGNLATSLLVGRVLGDVLAYANVCRHQPVPLDVDDRDVLAEDGLHLVCGWHGAVYRATDGSCVEGPCAGQGLFRAKVIALAGDRIAVEL